jgi:hypothetical protein
MNSDQIDLIVLQQIDANGGSLIPEGSLFTFVNLALPGTLTRSELRGRLAKLEEKRQVISVHVEGDVRWKCAAEGKARILEAAA